MNAAGILSINELSTVQLENNNSIMSEDGLAALLLEDVAANAPQ